LDNSSIRVEHLDDGVVVVTIDRPPVNALRFSDVAELNAVFKSLEAAPEDEVRVVILTAAGDRAFVAGADVNDLAALTPQTSVGALDLVQETCTRIYEFPTPVIAAVNGPALGSGVAFASVCDIRVASEKATFGLPEINVGVMGGSKHLARLLPQGRTRLMMYTAWRLGAQEALRFGVVESVVEPAALLDEALRIAREIASKLPVAVRLAKRGLNRTESMPLREGYAYECELTIELRGDPRSAEASRAFFEKASR
jgi:enoyl-CoA hydratase